MRTSQHLLATLKEVPADAEIVSHKLMLRAGMIRRVAAGIYNWLPTGMRVLHKVQDIVREEMDRSGAQEVLHPVAPWSHDQGTDLMGGDNEGVGGGDGHRQSEYRRIGSRPSPSRSSHQKRTRNDAARRESHLSSPVRCTEASLLIL